MASRATASRWRKVLLGGCVTLLAACGGPQILFCGPCAGSAKLDLAGLVKAGEYSDTIRICFRHACHIQAIPQAKGKPAPSIWMWGVDSSGTISDLTVSVMRNHAIVRQATASGSIHAMAVGSDCECRFVTFHYDPDTGKLYGR